MAYAHGKKWDYDETKKCILQVKETMGYKHFPTKSEIRAFYGNNALADRISRSGGTRYWAKELNLPIKNCESELGNDYELIAIKDIKEKTGLNSFQTKPRFPYDLLTNECVKIDVKVSYPYNYGSGEFNSFNLEKVTPTCDIFVFYCLSSKGEITKILIIPSTALYGISQLSVGKHSKWDIYKDCWHYISEYDLFISEYKRKITEDEMGE